jgi:3-oxoacyl-(acyl-carrier-protein) synthase
MNPRLLSGEATMIEAQNGRRVVITGLGVVAPCGFGVDEYWAGLAKPVEPAVIRRVPEMSPEKYGLGRVQSRRAISMLDAARSSSVPASAEC